MAKTVFLDHFLEAVDTNLASHTPDTGTGWTEVEDTVGTTMRTEATGDFMRLAAGGASSRIIYTAQCSPALSGPDYDVIWTVTAGVTGADDFAGAVARYVDVNNYYVAGPKGTGGNWVIGKVVAGVRTTLANGSAAAMTNGDIFTFELRGSTLRLLRNGVQVLSTTDSDLSVTGEPGFAFGNVLITTDDPVATWNIDDFEVVDQTVVAGGGQPTMKRWGGVPHVGGRKRFASGGSGGAWGRSKAGVWIPNHLRKAA